MSPEATKAIKTRPSLAAHRSQRGSMLLIAVFIITVMSLLGLAIVQMLSDTSRSVVYEVYGARAFNAANSGAQRTLQKLFPVSGAGSCLATDSLDLSTQIAFSGCSVTMTCQSFTVTESGYTHYRVESLADCTGGEFTTQRKIAVEARSR